MNSSTMRNAAFPIAAILACMVVLGSSVLTATPAAAADSTVVFTDAFWTAPPPAAYEENLDVYVEVTDLDEDEDPGVAETVTVTVIDTARGDSEIVTLYETGLSTGVFQGTLATLGLGGVADDGFLNVQGGPAGDVLTVDYADKDGGDTSQDTATLQDTVSPPALAAGELAAASGASGITVDLDWSTYDETLSGDIAGYHVYQSTTAYGWSTNPSATVVATYPVGTQAGTITGLTVGTVYHFAVGPYDSVPNEDRNVETARVKTKDTAPPVPANEVPAPNAPNVPIDSNISLDVLDEGLGVDINTVTIRVDGVWVTNHANTTIQAKGDPAIEILHDPTDNFACNATVEVRVVAKDDDGNTLNVIYEFYTIADNDAPQVVNKQFSDTGGWLSFDITDNLSGVDTSMIVVTVLGADVTAQCVIDDSDPLDVSVYYDSGGWPWHTPIDISVDCADLAGNVMPTDSWVEQSSTDSTAPAVSNLFPVDGEQNAAADTTVSLTFIDNESGINLATVDLTLETGGVPVAGAFAIDTKGEREIDVTFTPDAPGLDWETDYDAHAEATDDVGNTATVDWSFRTMEEPLYNISGMIVDGNADPLLGVEVMAGAFGPAMSDSTGRYRLQDLPAGLYNVVPTRANYDFAPTVEPVTLGPSAGDVDFVGTERTYDISGTVTQGGVGVAGVQVSTGGKTATTDGNGDYTIPDLRNGIYSVTCARDIEPDGFEDFIYNPTSRTVNVIGVDVVGVDFTATPVTYTIEGTISDSSGNRVGNVTVSDGTRTTVSDAAGRYTLAGVPASTVTVTPTRTGMAFDPVSTDVTVPPSATDVDFRVYEEFTRRFPAGRSIVALPLTPPPGQRRVVDIFQTVDVARWDGTAGPPAYVRGAAFPDHPELQARPGAAWFVDLPVARNITVAGDAVQNVGSFSVGLPVGWNMVGNMYQTALPLENMNAAGGGELRPFAFIFDNATNGYLMVSRVPAMNSARTFLEAWEGAWFRAVGTAVSVIVTAPSGTANLKEGADADADVSEGGWLIPVVARVGAAADLCTLAGVGSGPASAGYRVENPPKALGSVDVYFTEASGARLAHDVRPLGSANTTWDFVVETDISAARVDLTLPDLSGVPADRVVYLTDLDTGKRVYARTMPSYSFTAGADGARRHFQLAVEPKGADNLIITSASVQSSGTGAVVTYSVSSPCEVNVVVLNIAGRKIRSLAVAGPAVAGANVQTWNLRSDDGTLAPSGQYLVRIEAVADNGQRVQALRPLHVAR